MRMGASPHSDESVSASGRQGIAASVPSAAKNDSGGGSLGGGGGGRVLGFAGGGGMVVGSRVAGGGAGQGGLSTREWVGSKSETTSGPWLSILMKQESTSPILSL